MIGSDKLAMSMIRLPAADRLPPIKGARWDLIWGIHPANTSIDVMLVGSSNLQDTRDPVVVRPLDRSIGIAPTRPLPLDSRLVGHVDKALIRILIPVH